MKRWTSTEEQITKVLHALPVLSEGRRRRAAAGRKQSYTMGVCQLPEAIGGSEEMTDILELLAEPGAAVTRADVIREIERLREEKDKAYDNGFIVGTQKSPTYKENQELRAEIAQLQAEVVR